MGDSERTFANLGCGPRGASPKPAIFAEWQEIRVDIEPSVGPDVVADITDLSRFPSNSLDGVWASHCIEHLYPHQVTPALCEIQRILAPDGVACILTPDLQTVASYIAADKMHEPIYQAPAGPITPHDVVFGFGPEIAKGFTFMAHRCGFTPSVLVSNLQAASLNEFVIMRRGAFELAALARKTAWRSDAEREAMVALLRQ